MRRNSRFIKKRNRISGFSYYIRHFLKGFFHKFSKIFTVILIILILAFIVTKIGGAKSHSSKINKTNVEKSKETGTKTKNPKSEESSSSADKGNNELIKLNLPKSESESSQISSEAPLITEGNGTYTSTNLINTQNVKYQSSDYYNINNHFDNNVTTADLSKMKDINYLKNNFYIVDSETDITPEIFDINRFKSINLKIKNESGPKVLIFNTHSQEIYKDSKDTSEGVVGLGKELQRVLKEKYGIEAIDHEGIYDVVDGQHQVLGAYQRMTPDIEQVLKDNPSIEVCIDIHRDGLPDDVHLVKDVNGKPTAQFMFVDGISKIFGDDGKLKDAPGVPNPNLQANLAFSFYMKLMANQMYPGLTRKIYIHGYRYSTFMKPKSLLVEVGSQTNTFEEAKNAMEPLADILAAVIKPQN